MTTRPSGAPGLIGVDFSRPANDEAVLFAYVRELPGEVPAAVGIDPPPGWEVTGVETLPAGVGTPTIHRASLRATGGRFRVGSPAGLTLGMAGAVEHARLDLASDCLTLWTLWGPCPFDVPDGLDAMPEIDRMVESGELSPDRVPEGLPPRRGHPGLQCSGYVNLAAFLENVYGPVPSGDYKVYRRLAWAHAAVFVARPVGAVLEVTGEDRFRGWVNGREVLRSESRPIVTPARAAVRLAGGWNSIVLKAVQDGTREWGGRRWGFFARLRDTAGATLREVEMRLTPAAG